MADADTPPEVSLAQIDETISSLETVSSMPAMRQPNPKFCRLLHTYAKVSLAGIDYLAAFVDYKGDLWPQDKLDRLADLRDRAEELVDTFSWGLDGGEALNKFIDRELS